MPLLHHRHRTHPIIIITLILIFGTVVDAFCGFAPTNDNLLFSHTFVTAHHHHHSSRMKKKMTSSTAASTEIRMMDIDDNHYIDNTTSSSSPPRSNPSTLQPIKAGFIGLGTIASSIATALATTFHAPHHHLAQYANLSLHSISVTKRSESKSSKLKQSFPDIVTIYDSAKDVVQNSNVVFLCVLPQQLEEVLSELRKENVWRKEDHTLVSLVSTSNVEDLILQSNLPRNRVYKMICLPSIAKREGCALLQRAPTTAPSTASSTVAMKSSSSAAAAASSSISIDNNNTNNTSNNSTNMDENDGKIIIHHTDTGNDTTNQEGDEEKNFDIIKAMLTALGGCVECPNDDIMNTMMITSCMMGPLYGVMRNNRDWLVKNGVSPEDASYFVGRSYLSMVQDAERNCHDPKRLDDLIEEQTPGGLNEQSLRNLELQHVFESYDRTMDAILSRLRGESDGSLPS